MMTVKEFVEQLNCFSSIVIFVERDNKVLVHDSVDKYMDGNDELNIDFKKTPSYDGSIDEVMNSEIKEVTLSAGIHEVLMWLEV